MKGLEFEWNKNRDKVNILKHGISFDEAKTAFYDEYAIQFYDPEQSDNEVSGFTRLYHKFQKVSSKHIR